MEKQTVIPKGYLWPFLLLTTLFFAWAVPNNLTDTMLAAFKRIMSLSDSKTAWIQIVCYLLGYGCCAVPGAILIKRYSYKTGVLLGLGVYALGTFLFYPAMLVCGWSVEVGFLMFLLAIFILFAGLSVLETAANSYICALGPDQTATRRLNFAQSFNPFGAISGVVISQVFILSQLNTMTAAERVALPAEELARIQHAELNAVTTTYVILGVIMVLLLVTIRLTRMPDLKEQGGSVDLKQSLRRLCANRNYVWGVAAQFFYMGAQIAVWSFVIRYAMQQFGFNEIIASLGGGASDAAICEALRGVEPVAAGFYSVCESIGLDALLPHTAEQAGATYYILSLLCFVAMRFVCTALLKWVRPRVLLAVLSGVAIGCCLAAIYLRGAAGVYGLIGISGCMSLMFPTIYSMGIRGLGEDTKLGGSGMVMAIAGAAVLTQIQGIVSDSVGSIALAYWIPILSFAFILFYSTIICRKYEKA